MNVALLGALRIAVSVLVSTLVLACSGGQTIPGGSGPGASVPTAFTCPVAKYPLDQPNFGSQTPPVSGWFGDGELWAGQVIAYGDQRYAGGMKVAWYRVTPGVLLVEGRRLDGAAPPLKSNVPTGYGSSGFQSTMLTFPTEGCWEVTGKVVDATAPQVAKHELRIIVNVLPVASRPTNLR